MKQYSLLIQLLLLSTVVVMAAAFTPIPANANGDWIVVNTENDMDDGVCDNTHCSLREAINHANLLPGKQGISFNIPNSNPFAIIQACGPLPDITDPVLIDGTWPLGPNAPPRVVIRPDKRRECPITPPSHGFWIVANNVTIRNLSMVNFFSFQALVSGAIIVDTGANAVIENNLLGIYPTGFVQGNYNAIYLNDDHHTVRDNVISGNWNGIQVRGADVTIQGNFIGTDISGTTSNFSLRNAIGVFLTLWSEASVIGGVNPGEMNLISNNGTGIDVTSSHNTIIGNQIGTDISGTLDLGNSNGIIITGPRNTIGGDLPGEGNLISGNSMAISIGTAGDNNIIQGNLIGTDFSGTQPLANAQDNYRGMVILGQDNLVGGLNAGENNLIAYIIHEGIEFGMDASDNQIRGNTIIHNELGVLVKTDLWDTALRNTLTQNEIHSNSGLGIDLEPAGVSPNDPGDTDNGGNTVLNFPEFSVSMNAAAGTACPECVVELFFSDNDPSGYGEGETFIDSTIADTNGNFMIPLNLPISGCSRFSATATDLLGNTSEFSENVEFGFCLAVDPWVILTPLVAFGLSLGIGFFVGRKPNINGRTALAAAGAAGFALAGTLFVILRGPSELPPQGSEDSEVWSRLQSCSEYLEPDSISPTEGMLFELEDDPLFTWAPLDNLPPGSIRWTVELAKLSDSPESQSTSEAHLAFSTFGIQPDPATIFKWRLSGELADKDGGEWRFFCSPTDWLPFQIGLLPVVKAPSDTPEPSPTPTPTPTSQYCVYTAIENANCRSSDYKESEQIAILMQGESAELLSLNPEFTHGQFLLDQELCWIWLGLLDGPENPFGTCSVPIIDPAPACTSELDEQACILAGGQISETRTTAPYCVCPD